jgi:hypothetical protein
MQRIRQQYPMLVEALNLEETETIRSWCFWYFWITVGLAVIVALRSGSPIFTMLTELPIDLMIFFLPAWGIGSLIQYLRRG